MPDNLYKSRTNKMLAGVCGGVAEYFKIDATIVRLIWALSFFFGGAGFILYILAAIIIPDDTTIREDVVTQSYQRQEDDSNQQEFRTEEQDFEAKEYSIEKREEKRQQIFGLILICIGGYFILKRFYPFINLHNWWPVVLIAFGILILFRGRGVS